MEFLDLDSTSYAARVEKLRDEFTSRFIEFRGDEIKVQLFGHPFDFAVENSPDDCQMELIEVQAFTETKRGHSENSLVNFYKLNVCEKFPNLSHHARKMISLFSSTYCCEKFFRK